MSWSATTDVQVVDGTFEAKLTFPARTPAPGVLILHEIFGIDSYIEDVAAKVAAMGYVAMAPEVFWRFGRGISLEGRSPEAIKEAMSYGRRLDVALATSDLLAAMRVLRERPEVSSKVAVVGFCLGGTLAFLLAAEGDPDLCISYYGAGVPGMISRLSDVTCPVLFHFGASDPVISPERVAAVQTAALSRPDVTVHVFDGAGHAFDNPRAGDGFSAAASAEAWSENEKLLRSILPV